MSNKIPELLAPAGSASALNAAVRAGADAVYLGLQDFNARCGADNFTLETLKDACAYAHARGVKVYVALNTLVITRELSKVLSLTEKALDVGVDAFIVQDIGLASEISRVAGSNYVHISTQMNIHNLAGVSAAKALGAKRITLSRELSLLEIKNLSDFAHEFGMEIECFAHGAICVCYSGQCLLSSCVGARSANRGKCAQVCRLPYSLVAGNERKLVSDKSAPHLLSPKDMCTVDNLSDLIDAGVDSIKIEGRMKSPEYVNSVVKVYREVLENLQAGGEAKASKKQMDELKANFSRGFTNGYLFGNRGSELMSCDRPNNRGLFVGRVKKKRIVDEKTCELDLEISGDVNEKDTINVWNKHGGTIIKVPEILRSKGNMITIRTQAKCKDIREKDRVFKVRSEKDEFKCDFRLPRVPLQAKVTMKIGAPLIFEVKARGVQRVVEGPIVEAAKTKEVTAGDIKEHFDRLGETGFVLESFDIDLDDGVGIGFSQIHKLRSRALSELYEKISERQVLKRVKFEVSKTSHKKRQNDVQLCAVVSNAEDARTVNKMGFTPYVSALSHKMGQASRAGVVMESTTQATFPNETVLMSEIASHESIGESREALLNISAKDQLTSAKHIYCDDFASALRAKSEGKAFDVGQFCPVTNDLSIQLINNLKPEVVWLSPELNLSQIEDVASKIECDVGIFILGKQRLMTCEHCILMSEGPCTEQCQMCRRRRVAHYLVDRKNFEFPIRSDCLGRSTIYNACTLDLTCNLEELKKCGVNHFMIDATLMDAGELQSSISRVKEACRMVPKTKLKNSTSGHLFRGV